jgi:hypothetical protein
MHCKLLKTWNGRGESNPRIKLGKCAWPVPTTVHENRTILRRAAYKLIIAVSGHRLFDFWRQRARLGS